MSVPPQEAASLFFVDPETLRHFRGGALGPYVDTFAACLRDLGYARSPARRQIRLFVALGAWLRRRGLSARTLDEARVVRFLEHRRRAGHYLHGDRAALVRALDHLRDAGVVTKPTRATRGARSNGVEHDFRCHLEAERGLAASTQRGHLHVVRSLLQEFGNVRDLKASDVTGFVQRHALELSPGSARNLVTALRVFLRFLRARGTVRTDLAASVPRVAEWRLSTVPKAIRPDQVRQLLRSCDRSMPTGRRAFAVLLLLSRLGLRAGEVAALILDDIDWAAGEIIVRGKGPRLARMPLPQDVGEAIIEYLRHGRPHCTSRQIFLRARAPHRGFTDSRPVCAIVSRALAQADIHSLRRGAHLLRHTLATQMLRRGASLSEVGEVLRHRKPDTTAIYAKVDLDRLTAIALPWPGTP